MQDTTSAEKILGAARRLFVRNGIHATGIDQIIAEAGTARMTLYNRFGSKDGLVTAFLRREGEVWRGWFAQALERRATAPEDRLLGIFDALGEWFSQDDYYGCAFINAVAESCKDDDLVRDLTLEHKRQVLAMIERLADEAGFAEPARLAHQLALIMDGAITVALVTRDPSVAHMARETAKALLSTAARGNARGPADSESDKKIDRRAKAAAEPA
ncbi:MAG TPA: TetR/AcrR family transcriptional regulator [Stellaceae bacterium]|nr:TetR/AcrR family transcriptional regulator [Stellaceae bacterium]